MIDEDRNQSAGANMFCNRNRIELADAYARYHRIEHHALVVRAEYGCDDRMLDQVLSEPQSPGRESSSGRILKRALSKPRQLGRRGGQAMSPRVFRRRADDSLQGKQPTFDLSSARGSARLKSNVGFGIRWPTVTVIDVNDRPNCRVAIGELRDHRPENARERRPRT